jgi:hypothetical protein
MVSSKPLTTPSTSNAQKRVPLLGSALAHDLELDFSDIEGLVVEKQGFQVNDHVLFIHQTLFEHLPCARHYADEVL